MCFYATTTDIVSFLDTATDKGSYNHNAIL